MELERPPTVPEDEAEEAGRDLVQSLSRGLAVIRAFGAESPRMTLTQVAERTGLSRAAARRFLLTLVHEGYAVTDGRLFWLSPRILELGFAFLASMGIWDVAMPLMEEVVRRTGESCSASVLDGQDIVYVARVPASRIMTVSLGIGSRLPAYATSMGRVMLAGLQPEDLDAFLRKAELRRLTDRTITDEAELRRAIDQARSAGWALVDEELERGLRSLSVPVRDRAGRVVAALNVSCHASRTTVQQMIVEFLPLLQGVARQLSAVAHR